GSFYTVKEIWSPVQIADLRLDPARSSLRMTLRNGYSFTSLDQITFSWQALKWLLPGDWSGESQVIAAGKATGPPINPREQGAWELPIAADHLDQADAIQLTATDSRDHELWTWSVPR